MIKFIRVIKSLFNIKLNIFNIDSLYDILD